MAHIKKLWNVTVTASPELAEAFAAPLSEGSLALSIFSPPRKHRAHIEALYDAAPDRAGLTAQLAIIAALHHTRMPKIEIGNMPKTDWLAKVSGDFPPLPIARWIVHGTQHRKDVPLRRCALQIDATTAFGTGEHPTTRGCLVMLEGMLKKIPLPRSGRGRGPFTCAASEWEGEGLTSKPSPASLRSAPSPASRERVMLDLGCGSGILAMAWAQATPSHAVAVDLDPESVKVATHNVRANGLHSVIKTGFSRGYNSPLVRQNAPYDLIMSNIFAGPLCQMAKDLKRHLHPGGIAILSGILNHQVNRVLAAHRMQGLRLMRRIVIGEWSILALKRP